MFEALLPRLERILEHTNAVITKVYGGSPVSKEEVFDKCRNWAERMAPIIAPVEKIIHTALKANKNVLLEGAQGALLDLDHGTYPFVTSSNPTVGGACIGLGMSPIHIAGITGVFKAYSTRVGGGPLAHGATRRYRRIHPRPCPGVRRNDGQASPCGLVRRRGGALQRGGERLHFCHTHSP